MSEQDADKEHKKVCRGNDKKNKKCGGEGIIIYSPEFDGQQIGNNFKHFIIDMGDGKIATQFCCLL